MGGVEINGDSEVKNNQGKIISGLYASGELAGGIHGANRLGGSSLLDCVVFGRVAGDSASRFLFQNLSANRRLGQLAGQLAPYQANVTVDPARQLVNLQISWAQQGTPSTTLPTQSSPPVQGKSTEEPKKPQELKVYTLDEVAKHNKEDDCWVVVNGQVLNVTKFLPDHPGGKKSILQFRGKDASEEFNMLHEKNVIEKYAPYTVIGTLK
jgi:cytochrome b involved in lipid metabolism